MESRISATSAARHFADLVNRVYYRGEEFVIERGGTPVCRLAPVKPAVCTAEDLAQILRSAPRPGRGYAVSVKRALRNQPPMPADPWSR